jgi:hypothetical protein
MRAAVTRRLAAVLPDGAVRPLDIEPASGAVRLAQRFAAGTFDPPRYVEDP